MTGYVELQVTSNYSFLRGASRIEEFMLQAKAFGKAALTVTDRNTMAGIARACINASRWDCTLEGRGDGWPGKAVRLGLRMVKGIVLVRQKPGSAKGVMFVTIEDETGVANLVLLADRLRRSGGSCFRRA